MPLVLSSEDRSFVVFEQTENGSLPAKTTAVEFVGCLLLTTGFPNDEVLHGHRLWGRGLDFLRVHEVVHSSWLAEQQAIERHNPNSPDHPFDSLTHYLLTFQDSIVEALAAGLVIAGTWQSRAGALAALCDELAG